MSPVAPYSKSKIQCLNLKDARRLIIDNQDFDNKSLNGSNGVLKVIKHLGYIQIDTINVIRRAHEHVIFSRMPAFNSEYINKLYEDKRIFEYWAHAMAILPISSLKFTLKRKAQFQWQYPQYRNDDFYQLTEKVYNRIKKEGALESADFKDNSKRDIWEWKPAKAALETLFHQGRLMIAKRNNFRRVYDLTERVFPDINYMELPSNQESAAFQINNALQVNGLMTIKQISEYLRFADFNSINNTIVDMENQNKIKRTIIQNNTFFHKTGLNKEPKLSDNMIILSPFDNLIINRKRFKFFFNVDYKLECYKPIHKRTLGYFALPILYRDEICGFIDLKADRKNKKLIVNKMTLLRKLSKEEIRKLNETIHNFAIFNEVKNDNKI